MSPRASWCAALLLLLAIDAGAQSPPRHGWTSVWADGPPASGLSPAAWLDADGLGYGVAGAFALGLGRTKAADGAWERALELGARGLALDAREWPTGSLAARFVWTRAADEPAGARLGAWLAAGGLGSSDGADQVPLAGGGAWLERGRFVFTTQVVQLLRSVRGVAQAAPIDVTPDTFTLDDPAALTQDVGPLTGLEASAGWARGRAELRTLAGVALGRDRAPARWGEVRAAFWATRTVALFASARSTSRVPEALEATRGRGAAIGIQLAPGRAATAVAVAAERKDEGCTIAPLGGDAHRLTLRIAADRVEVACDATGWTAVEARGIGPDTWEVLLALPRGLHRIAIRVDGGAWQAPPGLPAAADEFGGEVGLLVVP